MSEDGPSPIELSWQRSKVRRGYSHPVTRTDFDRSLAEHPATRIRVVYLLEGIARGTEPKAFFRSIGRVDEYDDTGDYVFILGAHWDGPHSGGVTPEHTALLRFFPVASTARSECRAAVTQTLLPDALEWLRTIEAAAETVKDARHSGYGFLVNGKPVFLGSRW